MTAFQIFYFIVADAWLSQAQWIQHAPCNCHFANISNTRKIYRQRAVKGNENLVLEGLRLYRIEQHRSSDDFHTTKPFKVFVLLTSYSIIEWIGHNSNHTSFWKEIASRVFADIQWCFLLPVWTNRHPEGTLDTYELNNWNTIFPCPQFLSITCFCYFNPFIWHLFMFSNQIPILLFLYRLTEANHFL